MLHSHLAFSFKHHLLLTHGEFPTSIWSNDSSETMPSMLAIRALWVLNLFISSSIAFPSLDPIVPRAAASQPYEAPGPGDARARKSSELIR